MKVVMLEPGKLARTVELGEDLEAMQNAVGGTIQAIYPFEDEVALVCNDDGKCFGLPANRALYMNGEMVDIICGSAFICAAPSDSDSFQSLSDEQIKTYTDKNELVLDFTMGSGSTGEACINTNRKFIGIELDENYFNIAKQRTHEAYK